MIRPKLILIVATVTVAGLSVRVSAQTETDSSQEAHFQWGEETEGFTLSVQIKEPTVPAGEPLIAVIRFKNISDKELSVVSIGEERNYSFVVVRDSDGKEVPKLRYEQQFDLARAGSIFGGRAAISVAPGQVIEYEANLSRRFDLSLTGKYSVRVERPVMKLEGEGSTKLVSNTAVFTLK